MESNLDLHMAKLGELGHAGGMPLVTKMIVTTKWLTL